MPRFNTAETIAKAASTLTRPDANGKWFVTAPVVDLVRGVPIARDGVFCTLADNGAKVLASTAIAWGYFADRKLAQKAIKRAKAITPCAVPMGSNRGFCEGVLVQFADDDAKAYAVDQCVVDGHEGVMIMTLPAYTSLLSGQNGFEYVGMTVEASERSTQAISASDIVKGAAAIRAGIVRTKPATQFGPALTGVALGEDATAVIDPGHQPSAVEAAPNPYADAMGGPTIVEAVAQAAAQPAVINKYAAVTGRRGRSNR
jgi:hypothetical protein